MESYGESDLIVNSTRGLDDLQGPHVSNANLMERASQYNF